MAKPSNKPLVDLYAVQYNFLKGKTFYEWTSLRNLIVTCHCFEIKSCILNCDMA